MPGPCFLTGVSAVVSRVKSDFACTPARRFPFARCPAVIVTLEAGGAGTYTERAIPGSQAPPLAGGFQSAAWILVLANELGLGC